MSESRKFISYKDFRGGWNPDTAPSSLLDNELVQADNVVLDKRGALLSRKGLYKLRSAAYTGSVYQFIEWKRNDGTVIVLALIEFTEHITYLVKIDSTTGTAAIIHPMLSTKRIGWFVWNDKFFFGDGTTLDYYDGTNVYPAIPTAPAAPTLAVEAGVVITGGVYKYKVTLLNSLGAESDLGTEASINLPPGVDGGGIALTNIPVGATGTDTVKRRIYRTHVNGTTFYLLDEIGNNTTTTYSDHTADTSLTVAAIERAGTSVHKCTRLVWHPHSMRVFAAGNADDKVALYYSEANVPYDFRKASVVYPTQAEGAITNLAVFGDSTAIFYQNGVWAFSGTDPSLGTATWKKWPVPTGTTAPDAIVQVPGGLAFANKGGIYVISPAIADYTVAITPTDELVYNLARGKVLSVLQDAAHSESMILTWDHARERLLLSYGDDSAATTNLKILVLDWGLKAFTRWIAPSTINAMIVLTDGTFLLGTTDYALKGESTQYKDLNGASGVDVAVVATVVTKPFQMELPGFRKKLKRTFVTTNAAVADATTDLDVTVYGDNLANVVISNLDRTIATAGQELTNRYSTSLKALQFQAKAVFTTKEQQLTLHGFGFEFRPIKPASTKIS